MAGLGLGPGDFELFEIDDPDQRAAALDATLQPKLRLIGDLCLPGLARVAGRALVVHDARTPRRRGQTQEEVVVAFCDTPKGWRGVPYLAVALTRGHLHARVGVKGESPRRTAMRDALLREAEVQPLLEEYGREFVVAECRETLDREGRSSSPRGVSSATRSEEKGARRARISASRGRCSIRV